MGRLINYFKIKNIKPIIMKTTIRTHYFEVITIIKTVEPFPLSGLIVCNTAYSLSPLHNII